jgi:protein TonB
MEPKKNPSKDVHRFANHFFLLGLCISTLLCIIAFEWSSEVEQKHYHDPAIFASVPLYSVPITSIDEKRKTPELKKKNFVDLVQVKETTRPTESSSEEIPVEPESSDGPTTMEIETPPIEPVDTPFLFVEKMPEPVGGYEALYQFLKKNMNYPKLAKQRHTEGKVFVEFIIDKSGLPTNLRVLQGIGDGCDAEAIRIIQQTQWHAGKQRGQPVLVKMVLPVFFKLQ